MYCGKAVRLSGNLSEEANRVPIEILRYQFGPLLPSFPQAAVLPANPITCIAICGQTASVTAWLLLTAYRNLPMPYPTVPSPTTYGHLFFKNRGSYLPLELETTSIEPLRYYKYRSVVSRPQSTVRIGRL